MSDQPLLPNDNIGVRCTGLSPAYICLSLSILNSIPTHCIHLSSPIVDFLYKPFEHIVSDRILLCRTRVSRTVCSVLLVGVLSSYRIRVYRADCCVFLSGVFSLCQLRIYGGRCGFFLLGVVSSCWVRIHVG
jgi:hypothetical protein